MECVRTEKRKKDESDQVLIIGHEFHSIVIAIFPSLSLSLSFQSQKS